MTKYHSFILALCILIVACQPNGRAIPDNQALERELISVVHPKMKKVWPNKVESDSIEATRREPCGNCTDVDSFLMTSIKELLQIDDYKALLLAKESLIQRNYKGAYRVESSYIMLESSLLGDYEINSFILRIAVGETGYTSYLRPLKIYLLKKGNTVLLSEMRELPFGGFWDSEYQVIARVEHAGYGTFLKEYESVYARAISFLDLFHDEVVFGDWCDMAGIDPPNEFYRKKAVEMGDTALFTFWLTLPSLSKQLYAYKGLLALEKEGHELSRNQNRLIALFKDRKGSLYSCSGCIYSIEDVKRLTKLVESDYYSKNIDFN